MLRIKPSVKTAVLWQAELLGPFNSLGTENGFEVLQKFLKILWCTQPVHGHLIPKLL